jgi:hypothetical protein
MRPFNNIELRRSAIGGARTTRGTAGLSTIREGGGITHIVGRPQRQAQGFWALITGYHITEVKKKGEDESADYWETELFYVWHQVTLNPTLHEADPEVEDDLGFSNYKFLIDEDNPEEGIKGEVDGTDYLTNVLLDAHGLIPKDSLVWVKPTNFNYVWHRKPDSGVEDAISVPIYETSWQGIIEFELVDSEEETPLTNALLMDYDGVYTERPFVVENPNDFLVYSRVDEPELFIAGCKGTAYVQYDGRATIVNVEQHPSLIGGLVDHEDGFDSEDTTFLINNVHNIQLYTADIRHILDENDKVEVYNIFSYYGSKDAVCKCDYNYVLKQFELLQVSC